MTQPLRAVEDAALPPTDYERGSAARKVAEATATLGRARVGVLDLGASLRARFGEIEEAAKVASDAGVSIRVEFPDKVIEAAWMQFQRGDHIDIDLPPVAR